jgi:hypothetical protein
MFRKSMIIMLIMALLMSMTVFAVDETTETEDVFTDVNAEDWFYEAVMTMHGYGIISGYDNGDGTFSFKPNAPVTREEFATMMVKALDIETVKTTSSFADVSDGYWASEYIEAAKAYLTGFSKNGELRFKPKDDAVREDMAVALVKALDKPYSDNDLSALDEFEDANEISENLEKFMASAVKNNLMSGEVIEGKKYLKPMATLTRSEAAALLLSVVKEEKIVFEDEEKVVFGESDLNLEIKEIEGGLELNWNYTGETEASGFKVVASKSDETPAYPENGNAKYVQGNTAKVYSNDSYNGGDISTFKAGETYYFSITALVGEAYVTSNVLKVTMPAAISIEGKVPQVKVTQLNEGLVVEWEAIDTTGLQGYKVVASKYDDTPVYPDNGYAAWITNLNTLSYYVEPNSIYKGGDLGGKFKPGETYYFSVTAVYNSGKIAGNTVKFIMPGEPVEETPPVSTEEKTPTVEAVVSNGKLILEWSNVSLEGLEGYKIVASKSNDAPVYPADGYAFWITDLSVHRKEISPNTGYNGGDLGGKFLSGETYYVSVTAVYSDGKVPGNAVKIEMP